MDIKKTVQENNTAIEHEYQRVFEEGKQAGASELEQLKADFQAFRETSLEIEQGLRSQILELNELVTGVAQSRTVEEAWGQSERCYDWLYVRGFPSINKPHLNPFVTRETLDRSKVFLNPESLFLAIGHGDRKHQDWLKSELKQWFEAKWNLAEKPNGDETKGS